MTAAQLAHLAELAAFASDYVARTDPRAARMFAETASRADAISVALRREESAARYAVTTPEPPPRAEGPSLF